MRTILNSVLPLYSQMQTETIQLQAASASIREM
jgi:hypothetical protein